MKTVIEMAREAGFEVHERKQQARVGLDALCGIDSTAKLERFAELVRADAIADELEACADLCDQLVDNSRETRFAAAIRARRNTC